MIVVVVVLLAVAVVALAAVAWLIKGRLRAQIELTTDADRRATKRGEALERANAALEQSAQDRLAVEAEREQARLEAADAAAVAQTAAEEARAAEDRAIASDAACQQARLEAEGARSATERAEAALRLAEQRATDAVAGRGDGGGSELDADFLWALERSRSERTWRQSVALSPDDVSVFDHTDEPLVAALRVELDAAREEVGAVVDLEADLPSAPTTAGSVLTLRAAQELLAGVVRRCESTVVRLRAEGRDILVTVDAVDEYGERVEPPPLPSSPAVSTVDGGLRIIDALGPDPES